MRSTIARAQLAQQRISAAASATAPIKFSPLDEAIDQLHTPGQRAFGGLYLLGHAPQNDAERQRVSDVLVGMAQQDVKPGVYFQLEVLKKWLAPNASSQLAAAARTMSPETREPLLDYLAHAGEVGVAELITADLFGPDFSRHNKAKRRAAMLGPAAEEAVWRGLQDEKWSRRKEACELLGKIGTSQSIPILQRATRDRVRFVVKAAVAAKHQIQASGRKPIESRKSNLDSNGSHHAAAPRTENGPANDAREWVDATGTHRIKARLVRIDGNVVHLERAEDKVVVQVPLDQLSVSDQLHARNTVGISQ